nr:unnamed protein product [Callosobruchus analis]
MLSQDTFLAITSCKAANVGLVCHYEVISRPPKDQSNIKLCYKFYLISTTELVLLCELNSFALRLSDRRHVSGRYRVHIQIQ